LRRGQPLRYGKRETMTSRQPGISPQGAAGGSEMAGGSGTAGGGAREGLGLFWGGSARRWLVGAAPVVLLLILGLTGLRGVVVAPRWDGPLRRDGAVVWLVLEVVLATLLVITTRRQAAARVAGAIDPAGRATAGNAMAVKLRGVLTLVIITGMIGVAVATLVGLHLRAFKTNPKAHPVPGSTPKLPTAPPHIQGFSGFHIPVAPVLYALLVVLLIAGVLVSWLWSRRLRLRIGSRESGFIVEDPQDLREAVESGRSALRTLDDARAAIIACYVAMEASLAERGTARAVADTPDELLARAMDTGLVHGTAARRLTSLFYEARFSSHPLDRSQRDAAEQALDELAAALDDATATAGAAGADGAGTGGVGGVGG